MNTVNGMTDPMTSRAASPVDPDVMMATLEMALQERERQIDILRRDVDRYKRQSDKAQGQAAIAQAALDRHFAHCSRDEGAIQRLMAALAEATARRKEQVAIIERRDRRIAALQKELDELKGRGEGPTSIKRLKIWPLKYLIRS